MPNVLENSPNMVTMKFLQPHCGQADAHKFQFLENTIKMTKSQKYTILHLVGLIYSLWFRADILRLFSHAKIVGGLSLSRPLML